ncbi:putative membrane protein YccC [Rhizobium borbori]|uniref:Putative membrane protein YccC n=1 Tax=Allorhizobium borbori TaxID=485907 RepID=A0A7W6P3K8_9HYPH|nr:putative membrane protein YccC [Allorhizobium borbori]
MTLILPTLIALMAIGSVLVVFYIFWCINIRPRLPSEREAQRLAGWMKNTFGATAVAEAMDRVYSARDDEERRRWYRVTLYLRGRR